MTTCQKADMAHKGITVMAIKTSCECEKQGNVNIIYRAQRCLEYCP